MTAGFYHGPRWVPSDGTSFEAITLAALHQCATPHHIHVVGDSTLRFFYSALLTRFNVSRAAPHHFMDESDECAFSKVGWPKFDTPLEKRCMARWAGRCRDTNNSLISSCTYDHTSLDGWRLTFEYFHGSEFARHQPATLSPWLPGSRPDVVIFSAGVWEALDASQRVSAYESRVQASLEAIAAARLTCLVCADTTGSPPLAIVLGNGACAGAQHLRSRQTRGWWWPHVSFERRLMRKGNTLLASWAR